MSAENDEVWAVVPGFGGIHEVSSEGRIRRVEGWGRQILGSHKARGCPHVFLQWPGKTTTCRLARLVLMGFTGLTPPTTTVPVHLDGDRQNCRRDNLKWGRRVFTRREMPLVEHRPWIKSPKDLCDTIHRLGGKSPRTDDFA